MTYSPHTLQLSYGGSSLELSSSGSVILLEYVPRSPNLSTIDTNLILQDGGERPLTTRRNVRENARILVKSSASDRSDVQALKHKIQRWLIYGERRQELGSGSSVFVQYSPSYIDDTYQSEILSGDVEVNERSLDWHWTAGGVELLLNWTRRFYWEETSDRLLTLINPDETSTEVDLSNTLVTSTGSYNYVTISGSSVLGEVAGAPTIRIRNTSGDTWSNARLFIGHNVAAHPNDLEYILEAESGSGIYSTGGSIRLSSATSFGQYLAVPIPSSISTSVDIAKWELSGSFLDDCAGNHVNILCRFQTAIPASTFSQLKIEWPVSSLATTILEGEELEISGSQFAYLGGFRLPPTTKPGEETTHDDLALTLGIRSGTGGSIGIDYFMFFPSMTGHRFVEQVPGDGIGWGDYLFVDERADQIYKQTGLSGDTNKVAGFTITGKKIHLYPGEDQRLYFLNLDNYNAEVDSTMAVAVQYRYRRLSI